MDPTLRETAAYRVIRDRLQGIQDHPDTTISTNLTQATMQTIEDLVDVATTLRDKQAATKTPRFYLYTAGQTLDIIELAGSYKTFLEASLWIVLMQGAHSTLLLLDTHTFALTKVLSDNILHQLISETVISHLEELERNA
jgi:hypothetical protein